MKKNVINKGFATLAIMTFFALALTLFSSHAAFAAQASKTTVADKDNYFWHAELVNFDPSTRFITVKTMIVGENAPAEIAKLKAGEKITLTWSGADRYTAGISHAVAYSAAKTSERFSLPVEFVSYDATQKYMTFKTQVPTESVAKIKDLKPGEWVTATSVHGKATEAQPIVSIRPYVIQPNESSNSN
jgi:hypothetical protein